MNKSFYVVMVLLHVVPVVSMDTPHAKKAEKERFDYAVATIDDTADIVQFYDEVGMNEQDKIVVLPRAFRAGAVSASVEKQRYYVARNQAGELVALKKLFVLEGDEKQEVLSLELRCTGKPAKAARCNNGDLDYESDPAPFVIDEDGVYIYTGGDLTHPDYRGKGINTELTNKALEDQSDIVMDLIDGVSSLSLAYGVTNHNAGEGEGGAAGKDRTYSIVKSFQLFAKKVLKVDPEIMHRKFVAYKPSFDQNATDECKPLDDKHSVPGYGCLLTCDVLKGDDD